MFSIYYDPFLTFSNAVRGEFIDRNGKSCTESNCNIDALFGIGEEAFGYLYGGHCEKNEFDQGCARYWKSISEYRKLLVEMHKCGALVFTNAEGDRLLYDVSEIQDCEIPSLVWKLCPEWSRRDEFKSDLVEFFLFHALHEIDNALVGIAVDGRDAIAAAIEASNALSNAIAIQSGNKVEQEIRRDMAYRGAMEKLKRDPKQVAKAKVKECWDEWQLKPTNYRGKSAFAKDMMTKFDELDNQAVIARWCGQWEKEVDKLHSAG